MGTKKAFGLEERIDLNIRKSLENKTCSKCGFTGKKGIYFQRSNIKGIYQYGHCKKCHQEYTRAWRYGLTVEQMNIMLDKVTHCEICETKFTTNRKVIDHCHKNNHIRGILCDPCNTTLGQLEKTEDILFKMTNYLKTRNI